MFTHFHFQAVSDIHSVPLSDCPSCPLTCTSRLPQLSTQFHFQAALDAHLVPRPHCTQFNSHTLCQGPDCLICPLSSLPYRTTSAVHTVTHLFPWNKAKWNVSWYSVSISCKCVKCVYLSLHGRIRTHFRYGQAQGWVAFLRFPVEFLPQRSNILNLFLVVTHVRSRKLQKCT
jgi:hypothetical protein